jgi:hypothetical protein
LLGKPRVLPRYSAHSFLLAASRAAKSPGSGRGPLSRCNRGSRPNSADVVGAGSGVRTGLSARHAAAKDWRPGVATRFFRSDTRCRAGCARAKLRKAARSLDPAPLRGQATRLKSCSTPDVETTKTEKRCSAGSSVPVSYRLRLSLFSCVRRMASLQQSNAVPAWRQWMEQTIPRSCCNWATKSSRGKPNATASRGTVASGVCVVFVVPPLLKFLWSTPAQEPGQRLPGAAEPICPTFARANRRPQRFRLAIGLDNQSWFDQPL